MATTNMTLCRLSRTQAEHLMMAPTLAGGWVAVHSAACDSVEIALGSHPDGLQWAAYLALVPSAWEDIAGRVVTREQAVAILAALDHGVQILCEVREDRDADQLAAIAGRVRHWLAESV